MEKFFWQPYPMPIDDTCIYLAIIIIPFRSIPKGLSGNLLILLRQNHPTVVRKFSVALVVLRHECFRVDQNKLTTGGWTECNHRTIFEAQIWPFEIDVIPIFCQFAKFRPEKSPYIELIF